MLAIAPFDAGLILSCFPWRKFHGVTLCVTMRHTRSLTLSPRQQREHKLKRWFYSPNVQSKIIIESQTSTVKIQHRLRYRGPLLENGLSPNKIYMFFFSVQLCLKHHYLYKLDIGCQTWIRKYLLNTLHYFDFRLVQPITEKSANLPFKYVFL